MVFGQTQRGGPAPVMESAAAVNERLGKVGHLDATDVTREQGVTVTERIVDGDRIVTEAVSGQVVGLYIEQQVITSTTPARILPERYAITIGEALEATAISFPDKPIDQSDAAAIEAAEIRAAGIDTTLPGGVGIEALSAANLNNRILRDEDKTTLYDVLTDATAKLPADEPVTREDAQGVKSAEVRNKPDTSTTPGGVAASMAAAARLNQSRP